LKRKTAIQLIFITAAALSIVLKLLWSLPYQAYQGEHPWKGYQVVVIAETATTDLWEVEQALHNAGFEQVISLENQRVSFFRYSNSNYSNGSYSQNNGLALSALPGFLELKDPRYDPYLKKLPLYFMGRVEGRQAHVLYVGHERPFSYTRQLQSARDAIEGFGVPFYVTGVDSVKQMILWVFIGVTLLALCSLFPKRYRKKGWLYACTAGALLMLIGIDHITLGVFSWWSAQTIGWFVLIGWAGPAFTRYFNSEDATFFRALRKYAAMYLSCAIIGVVAVSISEGAASIGDARGAADFLSLLIGHTILNSVLHGLVLYCFYLVQKKVAKRQLHSLFVPLSIGVGQRLNKREIAVKGAVVLLLVGIVPLVVLPRTVSAFHTEAEFPMPSIGEPENAGNRESGFSWELLYRFATQTEDRTLNTSAEKLLPNITDYIRHQAFQEGYFYGMPYTFPEPGQKITIPVYRKEGIEVLSRDKVVKMFTDDWYKDIIGSAYTDGVPRLLLEQGRPVQVEIGKVEPFSISIYAILGHIGVILILVPVVFFIVSRKVNTQSFLIEKHQQKKGQKVA